MSYRAGNLSQNDHLSFLVYFVHSKSSAMMMMNEDQVSCFSAFSSFFSFFFFFFLPFWSVCVYVFNCSVVSDSATPWTVAHKAPLSMELFRQEYWNGLPFSTSGDLPDPGIEPGSAALQADSLPSWEYSPATSGFPDFWKPDSFSLEFLWWVRIQ